MSIIRFRFTGDTTSLDKASKKAKKQLEQLKDEFKSGATAAAKWGAASAAAAAIIGTRLVQKNLEAIDSQAKLAKSLDATAKELEIVTRAAGYSGVSIDGVAQATKDLTRRLSQAAGGAGPAADALERLDLTAEQLAAMPLDDRLFAINSAIDDFIPKAERAAVAGQLFGEEGSLAMRRIDPETIRQAAKDVDDFGTALSEIEVAQIEAANDELARVGMVVDGIGRKFTAEIAPIINAFAKSITGAARASDTLGDDVGDAADAVVNAMGFAMDAVDGVKRTFLIAGQAAATFALAIQRDAMKIAQYIFDFPIKAANDLIVLLNSVPGVDIDLVNRGQLSQSIEQEIKLMGLAVQAGKDAMSETLNAPLPSEQFKKYVEDARIASEEAAAAMLGESGDDGEGEEVASSGLNDADREKLEARVNAIRESYATEIELAREKFGLEQEALREALENELITKDEYQQSMLDAERSYQEESAKVNADAEARKTAIQKAANRDRRQALGTALSDLSTLMNTESRKQFEIGKAAAIADTVISTYEGAQKAYSSLAGIPIVGPALGIAAAGAAIAAGTARVQAIRSQSMGGSSTPAQTPTQNVNAASEPVAASSGGGGGGGESGGATTIALPSDGIITDMAGFIERLNEAVAEGAGPVNFVGA